MNPKNNIEVNQMLMNKLLNLGPTSYIRTLVKLHMPTIMVHYL